MTKKQERIIVKSLVRLSNEYMQVYNELKLYKKALEKLAEWHIDYDQKLKAECIIEGGILTEEGYQQEKEYLINDILTETKEELEGNKND